MHLQAESIDGQAAYQNLSALRGQVDGVLVSLPATKGDDVLREAASVGTRNVWV